MFVRVAARIGEAPRQLEFLALLSPVGRRILPAIAGIPAAPIPAFQEAWPLLVSSGGLHYRALAVEHEIDVVWFRVGPHAEYDRLLGGA